MSFGWWKGGEKTVRHELRERGFAVIANMFVLSPYSLPSLMFVQPSPRVRPDKDVL